MTKLIAENASLLRKKSKQTSETATRAKMMYDENCAKTPVDTVPWMQAAQMITLDTISLHFKHVACVEIQF